MKTENTKMKGGAHQCVLWGVRSLCTSCMSVDIRHTGCSSTGFLPKKHRKKKKNQAYFYTLIGLKIIKQVNSTKFKRRMVS